MRRGLGGGCEEMIVEKHVECDEKRTYLNFHFIHPNVHICRVVASIHVVCLLNLQFSKYSYMYIHKMHQI